MAPAISSDIRVTAATLAPSDPAGSAPRSDYAADWASAAPAAQAATASAPVSRPGDLARLETARVHAALADDVYNDTPSPPPGWRVAGGAELAALKLTPAMLSTASGFRARVYEGPGGRQVVAFRGSATRDDWRNDFRQAAGYGTTSYTHALDIGRAVARSGADVTFTGHSLGGGLASAAAVASGRPADTFNASGLSAPTLAKAAQINAQAHAGGSGRVEAWYVRGEVLSTVQDGGDRVIGGLLGGLLDGPVGAGLGAQIDAPPAYGARHPLAEVPPPGSGFFAAHDPIAMHGMGWVERGLDKAIATTK